NDLVKTFQSPALATILMDKWGAKPRLDCHNRSSKWRIEVCMRTSVKVANTRRVLCIFPAYSPAFGTFSHAFKLMPGVRAFMPPQGLLLVAAYMPAEWPVRFIDENIAPATRADLAWADVVLVSGMHIQARQIRDIHLRVRAAGKVMVLGGPSVSASPEIYPEIEYLHLGELGDATDR